MLTFTAKPNAHSKNKNEMGSLLFIYYDSIKYRPTEALNVLLAESIWCGGLVRINKAGQNANDQQEIPKTDTHSYTERRTKSSPDLNLWTWTAIKLYVW